MCNSFVDLQFPYGQLTYLSGEGTSSSAFLPLCKGLLQAQGHFPGEMRFSFSCKNKFGARITPVVQWPEKSFTLGLSQALAWKRSGLMSVSYFRWKQSLVADRTYSFGERAIKHDMWLCSNNTSCWQVQVERECW